MKNLLFCAICMFNLTLVCAQKPYGKMVVGIEGTSDVIRYNDGISPLPSAALQVEVPVGKFSVGTAIGQHNYKSSFLSYNYLNEREAMYTAGKKVLAYKYEETAYRARYWSVPLRVQYRLPCNCVYLHAAAAFDFLRESTPETQTVLLDEKPDNPESALPLNGGVRKVLHSYELGLGFKIHFNDYVRFIMRPTYVWTQYPDLAAEQEYYRTIRLTVGLQYAFLRYGGKF